MVQPQELGEQLYQVNNPITHLEDAENTRQRKSFSLPAYSEGVISHTLYFHER